MINQKSTLYKVFCTPLGHDVIKKIFLQMNIPYNAFARFMMKIVKLNWLIPFVGKDFVNSIISLVSSEPEILPKDTESSVKPEWWKEAVFYQIYPRSFKDSNADGIGDIGGIIQKLDYLEQLGINCLWLSPIYESPNRDNGYDISDYYSIMKAMGTMNDFDKLLSEAHSRGIKLIMDLVINHTSDQHAWYKDAITSKSSAHYPYYIFRDGIKGKNGQEPPNNWTSFFSGPAWRYEASLDQWALHLFANEQPDLNWRHDALRQELIDMISWWLKKGVDGFRLDVINYISKPKDLPDGNPIIGKMMQYYGIEHYFHGPLLHQYLRDLRNKAFKPFKAFAVGETPGIGFETARLLTNQSRDELDLIFNFDHLETPGHVRFDDYYYDLNYLKKFFITMYSHMDNKDWSALFFENHDNPRMVSKVNPLPQYRDALSKALLTILLTLKGTPFLFQGQELGAVNHPFTSIDEMQDVESINKFAELLALGKTKEEAFKIVLAGSRDHARVPMQWDKAGGFTEGQPWLGTQLKDGYSAEEQAESSKSILAFTKELIALRKKSPALIYGKLDFLQANKKNYFSYSRVLEEASTENSFVIEINLSDKPIKRLVKNATIILSNVEEKDNTVLLPYEASIYLK